MKSLSLISREQNAPISRVIEAANRLQLGAKIGEHKSAARVLTPAEEAVIVADLRNPARYNQFRANPPQSATSPEFARELKTRLSKGDRGEAIAKLAKTQPTAFNVAKAQGLI